MTNLILELLEIMDQECRECIEWQKNKPLIIKISIGDDD